MSTSTQVIGVAAAGVRALRRHATWWTIGIVAFVVMNAAVWPSLEGSDALAGLDSMESLLKAFGAENIGTPAGYLDGQIFALLLPLLLAAMAVSSMTALTSGDEDAGRLELLHALPVDRRAIWIGRWLASAVELVGVATVTGLVMVACLPVFSFDGVGIGAVLLATSGCALLALFHAAVVYLVGGLGGTRGLSIGIGVFALVFGYVASFLLPLSSSLAWARRASPWFWSIGSQPVSDGLVALHAAVVMLVVALFTAAGTAAVERRDLRSA